MNVVLCEYAEKREFTAGNKARTDTVQILKNSGYRHIPLYKSKSNKLIVMVQILTGCLKALLTAKKNEVIFIQYPYQPIIVNDILYYILNIGRRFRGYKIELLIHDSIGLREKINSQELKKEVVFLNNMDYVICHNENMLNMFMENGGRGNYKILGPFDYLYNGNPIVKVHGKPYSIIIAGNLSRNKSGYIYKLPETSNLNFNLYGINYTGTQNEKISHKGSFAPEELISHLEGDFGLVWDGDSCETNAGAYGQYLRYNNPHKFSLYIAAGIPLIVWSQSALASCVKDNNLGICIDSLYDLEQILDGLSKEDYEKMYFSIMEYRKDIIAGNHLKKVLTEI